jgi:hypothetical protein
MAFRGEGRPTRTPLLRPSEVDALVEAAPHKAVMTEALRWMREFLSRDHPDIGRPGSVCPFVPGAVQRETLLIAADESVDPIDVEATMIAIAQEFEGSIAELGPQAQFAADVVVFPNITASFAPGSIDAVQRRLKPSFVERGVMIGEFHQANETPAASPNATSGFFPNRAPIAMLAIRSAVDGDLRFLKFEGLSAVERLRLLRGYLTGVVRTTASARNRDSAAALLAVCEMQLETARRG